MTQPRFVHEHHCSLHRPTAWDEGKCSRRLRRLMLLDDRRPEWDLAPEAGRG